MTSLLLGAGDADTRLICRTTIAVRSKSFALASRLLPSGSRHAAEVLYTWCRRADDAVDGAAAKTALREVEALESSLEEIYSGAPQRDPVLASFQRLVHERHVPREYPQQLLLGMRMDAEGHRYESMQDLWIYCYRVAGVVGLMMCHALGVSDAAALPHAVNLGMAMQVTNICRDVVEDWHLGRLYLPRELLVRHGVADLEELLGQPFPAEARRPLACAVAELLGRADELYRDADRGLRYLPWRAALGVRAARSVYSEIGRRIEATGCDVLAGRAVVSKRRKLVLAMRALGESLLDLSERGLTPFRPVPLASPGLLLERYYGEPRT